MDPQARYTQTYFVVCRDFEVLFGGWADATKTNIRDAIRYSKNHVREGVSDVYRIYRVTISLYGDKKVNFYSRLVCVSKEETIYEEWADAMKTDLREAKKYAERLVKTGEAQSCQIYIVTINQIDLRGRQDVYIPRFGLDDVDPAEVRKRFKVR